MDQKILQPMVLQPAAQRQLRKPVLIITVTDGAPAGEQRLHIASVISNAVNQLRNSPYGPDAISFQFAQVSSKISQGLLSPDLGTDVVIVRVFRSAMISEHVISCKN